MKMSSKYPVMTTCMLISLRGAVSQALQGQPADPMWDELIGRYRSQCRDQTLPLLRVNAAARSRGKNDRESILWFRDTVWSFERDWDHKPATETEEIEPARKKRKVSALSAKTAQDLMSGKM